MPDSRPAVLACGLQLEFGDIEPEWVLTWMPPAFLARLRDRLTCPGLWEFQTAASHFAGEPPMCTMTGRRDKPEPELAGWIRGILGFPVDLVPDEISMKWADSRDRPRGPWRTLPLYWVRRNT